MTPRSSVPAKATWARVGRRRFAAKKPVKRDNA
jgi:hypothetical protein